MKTLKRAAKDICICFIKKITYYSKIKKSEWFLSPPSPIFKMYWAGLKHFYFPKLNCDWFITVFFQSRSSRLLLLQWCKAMLESCKENGGWYLFNIVYIHIRPDSISKWGLLCIVLLLKQILWSVSKSKSKRIKEMMLQINALDLISQNFDSNKL